MATTVEIVLRVVGSGAIAIGVLTAYGTVRMRLKVGQSHKWPTVPGRIVSSRKRDRAPQPQADHDIRRRHPLRLRSRRQGL